MDEIRFENFDKLNLRTFGENLFKIMEKGTSFPLTEGAYTISLNAEFGNGKTTFLKMFENFIKDEKSKNYDVLFINAWESDFSKEPVIAILSEFVNWIEENDKRGNEFDNGANKKNANKKIKDEISKIVGKLWDNKLGIILNTGNQAVKIGTGFDIKEAISPVIDSKNSNQEESIVGTSILKDFNQRREAIKEIKSIISNYIKDKKLLIIVDELDRTRPDYAVSFLEDMKHFFDIKNVAFLFAVNRNQIETTVKCLYGQNLNFNGYYGKFFKREINLLDPYREAYNFIYDLVKKDIWKQKEGEFIVNKHEEDAINLIVRATFLPCKIFELTLREIESFLSLFKMMFGSKNKSTHYFKIHMDCYSFFICLSIKKKEIFNQILNNTFKVDDLVGFLQKQSIDSLFKEKIYFFPNEEDKSLVNLLEAVACSLMTFDSSENDINKLMEFLVREKILFPYNNDIGSTEVARCTEIIKIMHPNRQNQYFKLFAMEICEKINICRLPNK